MITSPPRTNGAKFSDGYVGLSVRSRNSTSISANADGPRDATSRKINHIPLHVECNHQTTTDGQ